jgi:ABC-type transport system involved in multi-copper enzyme maturation permease subunit
MSLRSIAIIARLTLREALRRRLLWALVGLTVVIVVLTGWGFQRAAEASPLTGPEEQLVLSQLLVMIAFMFSFVLAMTAVFAGGPAIADELGSGQALALLARPLRRSELLLGKWLGLGLVLVGYAVAAGTAELAVADVTTGYLPQAPVAAVLGMTAEGLILLTLALVFSTRIGPVAGGAIAVVMFGLAWMAGVMGGVGRILGNTALTAIEPVSRLILPSDVLWRAAMYGLEPPRDVLDSVGAGGLVFRVSPFFAAAPPDPIWLAWSAVWVVLALALAAALLRGREI